MAACIRCGKVLTGDELGLYRKLICRTGDRYLCADCLAEDLGCDRKILEEKIRTFKRLGCALFPPAEE